MTLVGSGTENFPVVEGITVSEHVYVGDYVIWQTSKFTLLYIIIKQD